jgi:hypothetical protein
MSLIKTIYLIYTLNNLFIVTKSHKKKNLNICHLNVIHMHIILHSVLILTRSISYLLWIYGTLNKI